MVHTLVLIQTSQPGPYERIWKSDKLISPSLRAELLAAAVAPLESVPEAAKDWHPGSDGKVLDLVHPSLYPVVYGRSLDRTSGQHIRPRSSDVESMFRSERFQWLPSEFQVQNDGTVRLVSPYINNIHPENHGVLVDVIQRVLENAVPMFEWVLSDLGRERQLPTRLDLKGEKFPQCIWPDAVSHTLTDHRRSAFCSCRGSAGPIPKAKTVTVAWWSTNVCKPRIVNATMQNGRGT